MKKRIIFLYVLAVALSPAIHIPVRGQSYYSNDETGKGYWQVFTNPDTKNTVVQFFDANHRPLYKETMSRRYIKLNKKNISYFDGVLAKLNARNLLASEVKSYDFVADSRTTFRDIAEVLPEAPNNCMQTDESTVYVLSTGKMRIILTNLHQQRFNISILDQQSRSVYQETVNDAKFGRWYDMSYLKDGNYDIKINSPGKTLNYQLTVGNSSGFTLRDAN